MDQDAGGQLITDPNPIESGNTSSTSISATARRNWSKKLIVSEPEDELFMDCLANAAARQAQNLLFVVTTNVFSTRK
jgi:hypothetical protein